MFFVNDNHGEVLIVLDALIQLEEQDTPKLSWLPVENIPSVRWVVSTLRVSARMQ
jgi:hypothetical protein